MSDLDVTAHLSEELVLPVTTADVEEAVLWVLRAEGVDAAEISVAYVDDAQIAELNQQYLEHQGPTDVISFPLHAAGAAPLGDVYVGAEQARRQAEELGASLREELLRLAVHGTLHVLGYDHPEGPDRESSPMYQRQEALLAEILARSASTGPL